MDKYCKRYHDKRKWEETSLEDAVNNIYATGYSNRMPKAEIQILLENGVVIQTTRAFYRKGNLDHLNEMIDEVSKYNLINQTSQFSIKGKITQAEINEAIKKLKTISSKELWEELENDF